MQIMQKTLLTGAILATLNFTAMAAEHPMGPAQEVNGMEIGSVYLQPITMDKQMGLPADKAEAHIEADIHATKDNMHFAEGWWVPYLTISYKLEKVDTKTHKVLETQEGMLMPMVADDGPHYGSNVKLMGAGNYKITYKILPPGDNQKEAFGRHIDEETAAKPWFEPFEVSWEFPWAGEGEKGSYSK